MLLANRVMAVSKPYYNYYRHNNSITISHNGYQTMHFISMAYLIQEAAQLIKNYTGCVHKELGCWYTQKCFSLYDICKQIESLDRELLAKHSAMNPIMKLATGALYGGYFPQLLDLCIIKKIRGYDHVLIYGAGKVAKAFNQLLIDRDVKIKGFVVSRKTEESACMNTSIFALDDIPSVYLKGTLMCVMIKNTIEEEKIMCELIKKGFKRDDILLFDELR